MRTRPPTQAHRRRAHRAGRRAQVFLDCPNDRRFLGFARWRLGHLFPYLPKQPGYNKRVRALAPQIISLVNTLAFSSSAFCDRLWLLDSTPVPRGQSRETARRSSLAGHAAYGYCRSHSRYFWGFRLFLLCTPDGLPVGFELAAANVPERRAAAEILERVSVEDRVVLADKGFAGREFEQLVADCGGRLVRPDRRDEAPRFGSLGGARQWIESVFNTLKDQLSLERHRARTLVGVVARVAQRLLALAAGLWHNESIGEPGRHFTAYAH
ncbi:MAG: IS982 family transposase [Actinobacteria bacterium]|nr:IS982 family transposase [Actinomycetota bacterium]